MAHHKSAIKRIRQSRGRKIYNRANMKAVREVVKAVRTATSFDVAKPLLDKAFSILDRAAARGVVKKNTVANRKASLHALVKKLEAAGK